MGRIFQPLLFMLARCTRNELIRQIEFLKAENEILRSRLKKHHLQLRPAERARLLKLGKAIGPALEHVISIVRYQTFRCWLRDERQQKPVRKRGRRPTPEYVRELVIRIAQETGWGYTRILGELKKLGVTRISRQTVVNILKANGLEPGPRRGPGTWDEFLKIHAQTLWQCDFFSKRILSRVGMPQVFALVFLNVATRRVWISPATRHPTEVWVEEQAKAFIEHAKSEQLGVGLVTRDNDQIYKKGFDRVMKEAGVDSRRLAFRAPNTNAYVERFIQTLQVECLDHFLVFGKKHLDYLVREYVEHYHTERPHQGLGNLRIGERAPAEGVPVELGGVERRTRLGGLLSHYVRRAA
jgi:putative transposase